MPAIRPPGPITAALLALDLEFARKFAGERVPALTDDDLLDAMHKARYDLPELPIEARRISAAWLIERRLDDKNGCRVVMPWTDAKLA